MKHYLLLVNTLFFLLFSACQKDENRGLNMEEDTVEISGNGERYSFDTGLKNWSISEIKTNQSVNKLFGDILNADGELIARNVALALDSPGILSWTASGRSFKIYYQEDGSIEIAVGENLTRADFRFSVVLQRGTSQKIVHFIQPLSSGYDFKSIDYFLTDQDGDSLYTKSDLVIYHFDHVEEKEVEIFPFNGFNEVSSSFASDDPGAFLWNVEPIALNIPSILNDGRIELTNTKAVYGEIHQSILNRNDRVKIDTPKGKSSYTVYLQGRKRTISFLLTVTHKVTGAEKSITGKWIEYAPTGNYEIKRLE